MTLLHSIIAFMDSIAPASLAESWDNVGLLVGDPDQQITRIMTSLTITPEVADEAVEQEIDLIVSHHPCPFQAIKRITPDTPVGRVLLKLIGAGIAVYSPHTGYDSASVGINQQIAERLGVLDSIRPLVPSDTNPEVGVGRFGTVETSKSLPLKGLAGNVKDVLGANRVQIVGDPDSPVKQVAITCGAAGSLIDDAIRAGSDTLIIGEVKLHEALAAKNEGMNLIIPGHYASERFAVEWLAERLAQEFPDMQTVVSQADTDPFVTL